MKLKTRKRSDLQPRLSEPIVYMEVYGSNRVIYRVTAGSVIRQSVSEPFYGVTLEDLRTGERYQHRRLFVRSGTDHPLCQCAGAAGDSTVQPV